MKFHGWLLLLTGFIYLPQAPVHAARLKKVLIIKVKNLQEKAAYQYLEISITDAIKKSLKEKFAFQEAKNSTIQKVAKDNFIFPEDLHTRTGSFNLGLLANQDVVISGGFKIVKAKTEKTSKKKKAKGSVLIVTTIRIIDLKKKKVVSEFSEKGPADSRIFQTVERIATRIVREASSVLPSKEAWKRRSAEPDEGPPLIDSISVGLRAGGAFLYQGWGDYFDAEQPAFALIIRMNFPFIWDKLVFKSETFYIKQSLKQGQDTVLNNLNLVVSITNLIPAGFLAVDIPLSSKFTLTPKAGGGIVLQSMDAVGQFNASNNNSFPFVGGGLDFSYALSKTIALVLAVQTFVEMEEGIYTYLNVATLGANYVF